MTDLACRGKLLLRHWKTHKFRRWDGREERRPCDRALKIAVDVILTEARPDLGAQLLGLGQAKKVSGRGMRSTAVRAPILPTETPRLGSLRSYFEVATICLPRSVICCTLYMFFTISLWRRTTKYNLARLEEL